MKLNLRKGHVLVQRILQATAPELRFSGQAELGKERGPVAAGSSVAAGGWDGKVCVSSKTRHHTLRTGNFEPVAEFTSGRPCLEECRVMTHTRAVILCGQRRPYLSQLLWFRHKINIFL